MKELKLQNYRFIGESAVLPSPQAVSGDRTRPEMDVSSCWRLTAGLDFWGESS